MIRPGHEDVKFFVGTEVERSPAFGMRTLFVVGIQDPIKITGLAQKNDCNHIYFGANQSFPQLDINDAGVEWDRWEVMIKTCLKTGAWCTLDLDVTTAESILDTELVEHHRFIPMISVKLPYINQYGYNATIKLDDKDFDSTNPGVWCHSLHELQNKSAFTDWSKYSQDTCIQGDRRASRSK
jgi:hypothetical protein